MFQENKAVAFILVFLLGAILQVAFIFADCRQTATGTAIAFSEAYFQLDESMEDLLCSKLLEDGKDNIVSAYITKVSDDASQRGIHMGMARRALYHIKTETLSQDKESAKIVLTGTTRVSIHPVFTWVAKIFRLGETHEVHQELELVNEEGKWKVCGTPFDLQMDG
jgi:hypothetical protein